MVGFTPDGSVYNYSVLSHKETPGLGSKMDAWFVKEPKVILPERLRVHKDFRFQRTEETWNAITAATISSRAFLDAVNRAAKALAESAK